jgi:hypothetical protein
MFGKTTQGMEDQRTEHWGQTTSTKISHGMFLHDGGVSSSDRHAFTEEIQAEHARATPAETTIGQQ